MKKLKNFIEKNSLINHKNIGVAVSGGPDSVFMLYLLNKIKQQIGISITVLHFNHKIRKESDEDEMFTKKLSENMHLDFISANGNVPQFAKNHKLSLEDAARRKRYEFFKQCKIELNLHSIALAHTKNDLVETFLINMLRGSSINGLSSMKPKRDFYIRPILFMEKEEIVDFLNVKNIPFKIDKTNKDTYFLRNRVRLKLIKTLKEYNPNIIDTIYRESEILRGECEYLDDTACKNIVQSVKFYKNIAVADLSKMENSMAIRRRVISKVCKKLLKSSYSLSFNNIERIATLKNNSKTVVLRKIIRAYIKDNNLILERL